MRAAGICAPSQGGMARKVHWSRQSCSPSFGHPKGMPGGCSPSASCEKEPGRIGAEKLSKGDAPHQAALTHLGFCLKLHLHLLPAREEKLGECG